MISLLFKLKIPTFVKDFALIFTLKSPNIKLLIYYLRVDFVNLLMNFSQKFKNLKQILNKCLRR